MRIAVGVVMLSLLAAGCSKKEDAGKAPETAKAPVTASTPAAVGLPEGPKPGKWKLTTVMAAMPTPIVAEVCIPKTTFKDMQAAGQQAGVTCTDQTFTRVGSDVMTHAVCTMKNGMKTTSDSKFSGDFETRYTMESKTVMDPAPSPAMRETTMKITAERLGDC